MLQIFYRVRRKDNPKLFYRKRKPGDIHYMSFDSEGERYFRIPAAKKAVEFCAKGLLPVATEVVEYLLAIEEIGPISQKGL